VVKLVQAIHKFFTSGRSLLRIVIALHLLLIFILFVSDFFLNLFKNNEVIYQVQIVSTGDLNPSTPSAPQKKSAVHKPKPAKPSPKKVAKPKKVKRTPKKITKPKKVKRTPKKVPKPKKVKQTPKKVKPKRKVRTAADIRRDLQKSFKPSPPKRKVRDLSHLLNDQKVSAADIEKRFSQALNRVQVNSSRSGVNSSYNYNSYYSQLSSYLYGLWKEPQLPQNYAATIEVTVSKWGSVLKKRIVRGSGNQVMDQSVQQLLNRLTKLPKLPSSSKDRQLTIQITLQLEN
jgi:TonB family protein